MTAPGSRGPAAAPRTRPARRVLPPFHWWRTVFVLIPLIGLYTIVLGTISILSTLFDASGDFGHRCARAWSWLILKTTGVQVRVEGAAGLDPARSYVLASNHQSIYDIPILFASLPIQLRIVAKESLGSFPFLGWHLRRTGHLLVDRRNPGADIIEKMKRLVREAHSLIVFPEGTRSPDGRVGRFKKGSFLVAIDAGLPIVPVSVVGQPARDAQGTPDGLPRQRPRDRARPDPHRRRAPGGGHRPGSAGARRRPPRSGRAGRTRRGAAAWRGRAGGAIMAVWLNEPGIEHCT